MSLHGKTGGGVHCRLSYSAVFFRIFFFSGFHLLHFELLFRLSFSKRKAGPMCRLSVVLSENQEVFVEEDCSENVVVCGAGVFFVYCRLVFVVSYGGGYDQGR